MPGTFIAEQQVWDGAAMVPGWLDSDGVAHVGAPPAVLYESGGSYFNAYNQEVKADGSPLYETIIEGHRFYYDHTTGRLEYPPELTAHEIHLLLDRYPTAGGGIPQPWDYDDPIQHTQARGDIDYLFGFLPSGTLSALISTGLKVAGAELSMYLSTSPPTPDGSLAGGTGTDTLAGEAANDTLTGGAGADIPFLTDASGVTAVPITAQGLPAGPGLTPAELIQAVAPGGALAPVPVPEYTLARSGDLIRYTPPAEPAGALAPTPAFTALQPGDLLHYSPSVDPVGSLGHLLPSWSDAAAALGVGKAGLALAQMFTGGAAGAKATATTARAVPAGYGATPVAWYDNPGSLGGSVSEQPAQVEQAALDAGLAPLALTAGIGLALLYLTFSK